MLFLKCKIGNIKISKSKKIPILQLLSNFIKK